MEEDGTGEEEEDVGEEEAEDLGAGGVRGGVGNSVEASRARCAVGHRWIGVRLSTEWLHSKMVLR